MAAAVRTWNRTQAIAVLQAVRRATVEATAYRSSGSRRSRSLRLAPQGPPAVARVAPTGLMERQSDGATEILEVACGPPARALYRPRSSVSRRCPPGGIDW